MKTYTYPAILYSQLPTNTSDNETSIVVLVAPCDDIHTWSGIPRKQAAIIEEGANDESVQLHGYQREAGKKRVEQLVEFFQNPQNIIPTSILLARRFSDTLSFKPSETKVNFGGVTAQMGEVSISVKYSEDDSFEILLTRMIDALEARNPALKSTDIDQVSLARWKRDLATDTASVPKEANDNDDNDDDEDSSDESASTPYNPDSHIEDFYKEMKLRLHLCRDLPFLNEQKSVLGISKSMLLDYLAPATVVDGQHRLLGAVDALDNAVAEYMQSDEVEKLLASGKSGAQIEHDYRANHRRVFSANILWSSNWTEHVFQFVVVNQKVKPISKALLSSIISTSLNAQELEQINTRLDAAGIEIEDYRVMARIIEDPKSPFYGYVKKGYAARKSDEKNKLEWAVLSGLARDFRNLKGWCPYHDRGVGYIDPAKEWSKSLRNSKCYANYAIDNNLVEDEIWSHPTRGMWVKVFLHFFSVVREKLTDESTDEVRWGELPRTSNIFNGATMRSLLADFFDFLHNRDFSPDDLSDFEDVIGKYFEKIKIEFFNRKWNLPGNRVDRANMETLSRYLKNHRQTGRVDGKWLIFRS